MGIQLRLGALALVAFVATTGGSLAFGPGVGLIGDGALKGVKVSEGNSPRPVDRVYFNFNYFSSTPFPGVSNSVFRETIGFEKTFLDGNASVEFRLPFQQNNSTADIGDISVVFKYAFINDPATGNVLSTGLGLTVPTHGGSLEVQPFIGGIWTPQPGSPFFIHGFNSILVPIQHPDGSYLANDVGFGFTIPGPGTGIVDSIVPMVELHLNTPVANLGDTNINASAGVHVLFANGLDLGLGGSVGLAGPKPYDLEAIASINFRY